MEETGIPKRVLYKSLGTTRLRGRPRNRWQDGVREDARIVGGDGWQEKARNRGEWKKHLRTARNHQILHISMDCMNDVTSSILRDFFFYFYLTDSPVKRPEEDLYVGRNM
jgi:hypothetical protein